MATMFTSRENAEPKYGFQKNKKKGVKYYYKVRAVYSNTKCNSTLSETKSISLK